MFYTSFSAAKPLRLLAILCAFATPAHADQVVVFAAASLKTALDEIAADYSKSTGDEVVISYAGSNALAQQILQGAPAGIYVSAAEDWMDKVQEAGLIQPESRIDLLGNRLVLVAHGAKAPAIDLSQPVEITDILADGKLAMAMVDSVPAGKYGKAALQSLNLWVGLEPFVVQSENVRAALVLVARGEAALGVVYASDAVSEPGVSVVATFPETSHPPIRYPAALLADASPADRAFFLVLSQGDAQKVFADQGFTTLP